MYFPYFRGRQYELIALRELANKGLLGKSVFPVVEPVKITSTFNGTIDSFRSANLPIAIIANPAVGEISKLKNAFDEISEVFIEKGNDGVTPMLLLTKNAQTTMDSLVAKGITKENIITHIYNQDFINLYQVLFKSENPKYTLFPDERLIRRTVQQNKVLFGDRFKKKDRNADYPEDEVFSDDHFYFQEEGFSGFGDYSIIGNEYNESGYAPYAIAIHIVYFDDKNCKMLRIKHFVSDTNEDITDPAGKYFEAISKFADWYMNGQEWQKTTALSIFYNHFKTGYYPGLPTIKKLSIMHHLELMGKFLDGDFKK